MENQENIILIDWLTFTAKIDFFDYDIFHYLNLDRDYFTLLDKGYWGYTTRYHYNGINVLMGGNEDTVCVNLSGTGCRSFESFADHNLVDLLIKIFSDKDYIKVTRLDLAYDDHKGILNMQRMLDDVDDHNYTSRSQWWLVEYGSEGETIYFGSPKSNFRVRIYNKAAERGYDASTHWIRVEMQLRDVNASNAIQRIVESKYDIGLVFCGILRNYILFREASTGVNISRWPIADYWNALLDNAESITVFSSKGSNYNLFKLQSFVFDMAGSSIRTYVDIVGLDQVIYELTNRSFRRSSRQRILLNDYDIERKLQFEKDYFTCSDTFYCG